MGALVDAIIGFCEPDPEAWYVEHCSPPEPVDIPFDYHVSSAINVRMLHERGAGIGHRKGTVYHAIADRDIALSRSTRTMGFALCGARFRDLSSSHEPVNCPKCEAIVLKMNLKRSIKHNVGAWQ